MSITNREVGALVVGLALGVYFAPGIRRLVSIVMGAAESATT